MKANRKNYMELVESKSLLNNQNNNIQYSNSEDKDWNQYHNNQEEIKKIEEQLEQYPTVTVSYWIGGRSYYDEVIKLGQSYFLRGRSMTKSNGYHSINEIEEITEQMQHDMYADAYYY